MRDTPENLIDGARDVPEPATGKALSNVGFANAVDIELATTAAEKAQPEWAAVSAPF